MIKITLVFFIVVIYFNSSTPSTRFIKFRAHKILCSSWVRVRVGGCNYFERGSSYNFDRTSLTGALSQFHLPKIFPSHNEVVVESTSDLILGCAGIEHVTWTVPDSISKRKYKIESVDIYQGRKIDSRYMFGSILKVEKVSVYDIGFYTCHGNTTSKDNPTRANSIYVYVRDKDILMFSRNNKDFITMKNFIHLNLTLPCMPTAPDVSVTLLTKDGQSFKKVPTNRSKFDPRSGFKLKMSDMDHEIRKYKCEFRRNTKKQYMTVDIEPQEPSSINKPHIDVPKPFILKYIGDDLKLNCSAIAEKDSLFNLNWVLPNNSIAHEVRFFPNVQLKKNKLLLSELKVQNLTLNDKGKYKCYVGPDYKFDLFYTVHLTVIDRNSKISLPKISYESENVTTYANTSDIIINSKDNLTLHCESQENITWSYSGPSYEYLSNTSNNFVVNTSTSAQNKVRSYHSTLILENSTYSNGGFYYCHKIETEINNPYQSSKIFVFIRDEEDLVLFPTQKFLYMSPPFNNFWVPCIPTYPDVKVNITNKINDYVYDPRYGFKLSDPVTEIECSFTRAWDALEQYRTIYINLANSFTPETNIIAPVNEIQLITETLVLTCTILVNNSKDYFLNWNIPNPNISKAEISDETIQLNNAKVLISTLMIRNVQTEDIGNYTCSYTHISSSSVHIRVNPPFNSEPSINATLVRNLGNTIITIDCRIHVDHNIPFDLKWNMINNDDTIIATTDVQYNISLRNIEGIITYSYKMENNTLQDQQNISCSAFDRSYIKTITKSNMSILAVTKPIISDSNMENVMSFEIGSTIVIRCPVEGYPEPNILYKKDNHTIEMNERIQIFNKTALKIDAAQKDDSGMYSCIATNVMGSACKYMQVVVQIDKASYDMYVFLIVIIIIAMSIFTLICSIKLKQMKKYSKKLEIQQFKKENFEDFIRDKRFSESQFLPYIQKWELPRNRIKLRERIGAGNFGIVMKADYLGTSNEEARKLVAVKMIRNCFDFDELNMFLSEVKIMMCYVGKHLNIINLIGVCSNNISQGELLIIVEYCKFGNLRNYLLVNRANFIDENNSNPGSEYVNIFNRNSANQNPCISYNTNSVQRYTNTNDESIHKQISSKDLIYWSYQIATGMEYLSSIKILHADLAARNILLSDNNIIKICDFGLSKNLYNATNYKKKKQVPLPIKWMAVESIRDGVFSVQSDVWSFGIVLWELFSLGQTPYSDLLVDSEFCNKLYSGYRMEQPQFSSKEIYQIMLDCWHEKPSCRPTFSKLVHLFEGLLTEETGKCYREMSENYNRSENEENVEDNVYLLS